MNDRPEMECRGSGPTVENGFFELRSILRLDRKPQNFLSLSVQVSIGCTELHKGTQASGVRVGRRPADRLPGFMMRSVAELFGALFLLTCESWLPTD